jgi:hypothetical protein
MEETLEGGQGPHRAVAPLERERKVTGGGVIILIKISLNYPFSCTSEV